MAKHSQDETENTEGVGSTARKERVVKKSSVVDSGLSVVSDAASQPLTVFSSSHYSQPPEPPEENVYEIIDEDGDVIGERITPTMKKPWRFEYYYTPQRKARIARHILFGGLCMGLAIGSFLQSSEATTPAIITFFIFLLLTINEIVRQLGGGLWKYPMPEIPVLSQWDYGSTWETMRKNAEENRKQNKASDEEYDEFIEENSIEYVTPVEELNDDGDPSPATVLTRWMNGVHLDTDDIIEQSDGKLDKFSMKMLLSDNEMAWTDDEIVDAISRVTGSHPEEWERCWENYNQ